VSNEDELMGRVIRSQSWSGFSKVDKISTIKLSPDIDFLQVDTIWGMTEGYEFKLIKYREDWKRANLMSMYTGLGEAVHYFQFGVDKSHLVLGMSNTIPPDALEVSMKKVMEFLLPLSTFQTMGVGCLGVYLWNERNDMLKQLLTPKEDFILHDDIKHLKTCLLKGQFKYDKQFENGFEKS